MVVIYSNNPVYYLITSVRKQQLEIKQAQLEKQTNIERGDEKLQMKRRYLCTQRNESSLIEIWCGQTNVKHTKNNP